MTSRPHHFNTVTPITDNKTVDNTVQIMGMLDQLLIERTAHVKPEIPLDLAKIEFQSWYTSGRAKKLSKNTLSMRKNIWGRFCWWMEQNSYTTISKTVLEEFIIYVNEGSPAGRWGISNLTSEARPSTVLTYYRYLASFFRYLEKQNIIPYSPIRKVERPPDTRDQIKPFSEEQILELVNAAENYPNTLRNQAIVWLMFDTGMRVSEMVELNIGDIDLQGWSVEVLGKGNKRRKLYFNQTAHQSLWRYLQSDRRKHDEPLFISCNNRYRGKRMTRWGISSVIETLGTNIRLQSNIRTSPHTLRHTYAVTYLRDGGKERSLMNFLGHTTLTMTSRYVNFSDADLEEEHRRHSPADRITNKSRRR